MGNSSSSSSSNNNTTNNEGEVINDLISGEYGLIFEEEVAVEDDEDESDELYLPINLCDEMNNNAQKEEEEDDGGDGDNDKKKKKKKKKKNESGKRDEYIPHKTRRASQRLLLFPPKSLKQFRQKSMDVINTARKNAEKHLQQYIHREALNEKLISSRLGEEETNAVKQSMNLEGVLSKECPEFLSNLTIDRITVPYTHRVDETLGDAIMKLTVSESGRALQLLTLRDPTTLSGDANVIIIEGETVESKGEKKELLAIIFRDVIPPPLSKLANSFYEIYSQNNTLYTRGCRASTFPEIDMMMRQFKSSEAMDAAGFKDNVRRILGVRVTRTGKNVMLRYRNRRGKIIEWAFTSSLDRRSVDRNQYSNEDCEPLFAFMDMIYKNVVQYWIKENGCPEEEIDNEINDLMQKLQITGNKIQQTKNKMGIHSDPSLPYPSLVFGPTVNKWNDELEEWVRSCEGGNLFLADGFIKLPYSPFDIVFINGNASHGVTNLKGGKGSSNQTTAYSRFSIQLYPNHKRNENKHGKYGSYDSNIWSGSD